MNKDQLDNATEPRSVVQQQACSAFVIGMPDTNGFMCWLAGDTPEARYYTPSMARRFQTAIEAEAVMIGSGRAYKILRESEMPQYTPPHLQGPNAKILPTASNEH